MFPKVGVLALLLASVLAGCGGGGDPTGGGGGGNGFTATIAGQAWASNGAPYLQLVSGSTPGSLIIQGQQLEGASSYRSISLILGRIEGPGTYPLGVDGSTVAGGSATLLIASGGAPATWSTPLSGAAGSVTISSVSGGRIVGTFTFTAEPLPGQSGSNQTVTNGQFNLPLPNNFVVASGSSRASTMSGTFGGNAWNAASITPVGGLPNVVLGGLNATTYSLTIIPSPGISIGAFPLSAGTTLRVSQVGQLNSWGTPAAGTTGTVTITSINGSRVTGTFNATLGLFTGSGGSIAATGSFDINLNLTN